MRETQKDPWKPFSSSFFFLVLKMSNTKAPQLVTQLGGKGEDPGGMPYPFSATQGETTSARHTARSALQVGNSSHFGIHHGVVIW